MAFNMIGSVRCTVYQNRSRVPQISWCTRTDAACTGCSGAGGLLTVLSLARVRLQCSAVQQSPRDERQRIQMLRFRHVSALKCGCLFTIRGGINKYVAEHVALYECLQMCGTIINNLTIPSRKMNRNVMLISE